MSDATDLILEEKGGWLAGWLEGQLLHVHVCAKYHRQFLLFSLQLSVLSNPTIHNRVRSAEWLGEKANPIY